MQKERWRGELEFRNFTSGTAVPFLVDCSLSTIKVAEAELRR
jgi:hypothetical protein